MKNICFDIVIPTFNRGSIIERAINSVIKQTYNEWNLYILDNASTDNTVNIIEKFLSKNIHHLRNEHNIGMTRNWLKGIREIGNNKYVVLLSDDDELCPDFLEKASIAIYNYPDLGLYSSAVYINHKNSTNIWMSEYIKNENKEYDVCLPSENLHYYLGGNPISPAAILVNRDSIESIFDQDLASPIAWGFDRYWWAQIAIKHTTVFCNMPTAIYYQHEQSATYDTNKNNFDQISKSLRVTAKIINAAYNFGNVNTLRLKAEIEKLESQQQLSVLSSIILFGHKELYKFALVYFDENKKMLLKNTHNLTKKVIIKLFGLKVASYLMMYKNRS